MPAKPEKSNANRRTHMIYSVQGDFIHESRAHTSTKQIAEFLPMILKLFNSPSNVKTPVNYFIALGR